jgi:hypothetical protein
MAHAATWVKGSRVTRAVRIAGDDPLEVHQSFVGVTYVTRVAEGR